MVTQTPIIMSGIFAGLADDFIEFKRAQGYKYHSEAKVLRRFCEFAESYQLSEPVITKKLAEDWIAVRDGEAPKSRSHRITCVHQFGKFLRNTGYEAHILPPLSHWNSGSFVPYINRSGNKFTQNGIRYILKKYIAEAENLCEYAFSDSITPHSFRHSKAMHLLQAGVNLVYIRDLLGHSDVSTTEIYARADEHSKRKALEEAYKSPAPNSPQIAATWNQDSELMAWLKTLGK